MENSRFKFRAWDEIDHEMLDADDMKYGVQYNDKTLSLISQKECFTFMQYTGLKDINDSGSKEVYEYDILYDGDGSYYKVEWDYRNTGWVGINMYNNSKKNLVELLLKHSIVIGNIYENKELLNLDGKTK